MAFSYYSPVTVNSSQVPSTQTNFPMLVSYTDNRLRTTGNGGHVENANGYDVRPYSDSSLSTALTFELERYNASTGEVVMWVKIPSLADAYVVYLAYGDSGLTTNGSSTSTWDSNYKAVYHFPDGSTLGLEDSTSNNNDGTNSGATATTGKIDGGIAFGSGDTFTAAAPATGTGAKTWEMWLKTSVIGQDIFATPVTVDFLGAKVFSLFLDGSGFPRINVTDGQQMRLDNVTDLSNNAWHYISWNFPTSAGGNSIIGTDTKSRIDGSAGVTTAASGGFGFTFDSGTSTYGSTSLGDMDEIRISDIERSVDWIRTSYNTQSAPSTFATLGTEVPVSSSAIKTINGLVKASVKVVNGLAIASVKTWNGLA